MDRARGFITGSFMAAMGFMMASAFLYVMGQGFAYIPLIEGAWWPVVSIAPVTKTYRDDEVACFGLDVTKLLAGAPADYLFYGNTSSKDSGVTVSPLIPLSAYTAMAEMPHRRDRRPWKNHEVGESWTRWWCFGLPGTVQPWQPILVNGTAYHHRHWFYDSQTKIPAFIIGGLSGAASAPSPAPPR